MRSLFSFLTIKVGSSYDGFEGRPGIQEGLLRQRGGMAYARCCIEPPLRFRGRYCKRDFVQGYFPDQEGFDRSGKQASKTNFMPGSAEEMVGHAIDMLKESYSSIK